MIRKLIGSYTHLGLPLLILACGVEGSPDATSAGVSSGGQSFDESVTGGQAPAIQSAATAPEGIGGTADGSPTSTSEERTGTGGMGGHGNDIEASASPTSATVPPTSPSDPETTLSSGGQTSGEPDDGQGSQNDTATPEEESASAATGDDRGAAGASGTAHGGEGPDPASASPDTLSEGGHGNVTTAAESSESSESSGSSGSSGSSAIALPTPTTDVDATATTAVDGLECVGYPTPTPVDPSQGNHGHSAIDLPCDDGASLRNPFPVSARVSYLETRYHNTGWYDDEAAYVAACYPPPSDPEAACNNEIRLEATIDGVTWTAVMLHISGSHLSQNEVVDSGANVAICSDVGWASGPHVHFELHEGDGPVYHYPGDYLSPDCLGTPPDSCPYGDGFYCGGSVGLDPGILYKCEGGIYTVEEDCPGECVQASVYDPGYCADVPSCPDGNGLYCGEEVGLDPHTLYDCADGVYTVREVCPDVCVAGDPDRCDALVQFLPPTCGTAGCSGELCVASSRFTDDGRETICLYLPEYACYRNATCELQPDGGCGWTQTEELLTCLEEAG